ncbi:MAG TPA: diguanylate cyclase [Gammaproteobacteria bacterium]
MDLPALDRANVRSPYAEQLNAGFRRLRFHGPLEKEFREFYLAQNLPRGRLAMLIALLPLFAVTVLASMLEPSAATPHMNRLRLFVLFPLLLGTVISMHLEIAKRWYTELAATSITLAGIVVTYICHVAALNGASYLLSGQVLVILYACLFLGLLFDVATVVGGVLVVWHIVIGLIVDLPVEQLWYSCAILGTAAATASITTYKLEHAIRTNFLETRLLHDLAERDGMTGLYNRRIFDDHAKRVWRQSRREEQTLAIVFVDIDDFKVYNDLYGHQAGDDCLKKVAATIARSAKRPFDFTARYGGEEFVVLLYGPPSDYARSMPERIRQDVAALAIPHEGSRAADVVTVSVGVALAGPGSARSLAGAIQVADEALYEAKKAGRNRVVFKTTDDWEVETGNFRTLFRRPA